MPSTKPLSVLLLSSIVGSGAALASKEGVLSLGTFQVSSPGIAESGPVIVSGSRTGEAVTALCVQAFNHTRCLTAQQLMQLSGSTINGVQISYEASRKELGGRMVYVLLSKGFTSARLEAKLISVSESGQVEVQSVPEQ